VYECEMVLEFSLYVSGKIDFVGHWKLTNWKHRWEVLPTFVHF